METKFLAVKCNTAGQRHSDGWDRVYDGKEVWNRNEMEITCYLILLIVRTIALCFLVQCTFEEFRANK